METPGAARSLPEPRLVDSPEPETEGLGRAVRALDERRAHSDEQIANPEGVEGREQRSLSCREDEL
jgi:hypothetical protein